MNILVALPTVADAQSALSEWSGRIREDDTLALLAFVASKSPYDVETLRLLPCTFNFKRRFISRLHRRVMRLLPHHASPLWRSLYRTYARDIAAELRACDPDVLDLRYLPANDLVREIAADMRCIVLTDDVPSECNIIKTNWRSYDPNILVSIVLPVYNGANYLRTALASCLIQTHRALELIVVDDCSSDETPAIVEEIAKHDPRVISVRNERNLRLPQTLNVGFARSTGSLLTWTSHDNYYAPNAIEHLVRYLCTWPNVDFVYSDYRIIDQEGAVRGYVSTQPPVFLAKENVVGAYFMYRRSVYEQVGPYRADLEYVEDYEYWARIYRRGLIMQHLHAPFYYYRRHAASMTTEAEGELIRSKIRQVKLEHFPESLN